MQGSSSQAGVPTTGSDALELPPELLPELTTELLPELPPELLPEGLPEEPLEEPLEETPEPLSKPTTPAASARTGGDASTGSRPPTMTSPPQLGKLGIKTAKDTNAVCASFICRPPEFATNGRGISF